MELQKQYLNGWMSYGNQADNDLTAFHVPDTMLGTLQTFSQNLLQTMPMSSFHRRELAREYSTYLTPHSHYKWQKQNASQS